MTKRTTISKKVRFEVFRRDSFTCQYCGRKAPDVVLECDHILPVAEGGENDMMNLITSCRDCNRGKGKVKLDDSHVVEKQRTRLDELNERREQMEMLLEWREELLDVEEHQVDAAESIIQKVTGDDSCLSEFGRTNMMKLIDRFGLEEVLTACVISYRKYYKKTDSSWEFAFNKIGGICYNRKYRSDEYAEQDH